MEEKRKMSVKAGIWGFVIGGIITMIVGFMLGGWMLSGTAKELAKEAVQTTQAEYCVQNFMKNPDFEKNLKLFKKEGWSGSNFIRENGFATPPGEKEPSNSVANLCSDLLQKTEEYKALE